MEFRRRVRAVVGHVIKSNEAGPMVVHCNDGGGRSGVYLSIDANIELAEEEDKFDVYGYLKKLRQSRKGLVENLVSAFYLTFTLKIMLTIIFIQFQIYHTYNKKYTSGCMLF